MVRFNDKPFITTLSDDDIMPITDMSDPSSDKKMNMKQLSEYVANLASHDVASAFKTLGTETVSSDSSAYKEILDRKRNTFDRSKFEVVGNPTITDDGIVSGFSDSNYVKTINIDKLATDIEIKIKARLGSDVTNAQRIIAQATTNRTTPQLEVANGSFALLYSTDGINWGTTIRNVGVAIPNSEYYFKIKQKDGVLTFSVSEDGSTYQILGTRETNTLAVKDVMTLGWDTDSHPNYFTGSIDLKSFSITVDGVEVFNGNKTGIDQIKKDDYTVVGSPIISADGIASGFSSSNYLKIPSLDYNTSSIRIKGAFVTDSTNTGVQIILGGKQDYYFMLFNNLGTLTLNIGNGTSYNYLATAKLKVLNPNTPYTYDIVITSSQVNTTINNEVITPITITNFNCNVSNLLYSIGVREYHSNRASFLGSIDLNSFKIYVDDQLVYQPTLRIPYTQSKTGGKIVNASYRDRVFDLYEQTGKALYYTIDEESKNFTAPLSDIYGMVTDNASLKNFTPEGKERFEAQNSYLTGNVLKEEQGLNQVKMMKRSTFDLSKFSTYGSPVISEDGIFMATEQGNSVYKVFNMPIKNSITHRIRGIHSTKPNTANGSKIILNTGVHGVRCGVNNDNARINVVVASATGQGGRNYNIGRTLVDGDILDFELTTTHTGSNIKVWLNEAIIINELISNPEDYLSDINSFESSFGNTSSTGSTYYWTGSTVLPCASVVVDGVEVFNGNKTGIDQIKKDDFEIVGSPTAENGVYSNFSTSNYLKAKQIDLSKASKWRIDLPLFKLNNWASSGTGAIQIFSSITNYIVGLAVNNGSHKVSMSVGNVDNTSWITINSTQDIETGIFYKGYIEFTGSAYNLYLSTDYGRTYELWCTRQSTDRVPFVENSEIVFGQGRTVATSTTYQQLVVLDMNSCKFYVNDELMYLPTLCIPYTKSKTGSKIVDATYRDRVQGMYEKFGYAPYYTLEDDSFTLPKGEIYGLIGSRSLKSHFRSGINYYDVYSDRELEQGGACTANVAVNLLKPYEDENYVLSVPYSAKTATSFTPTTSGTWMAKGIAKSLD